MIVFFNAFFGNYVEAFDFVDQTALTDHLWLWIVALIFCLPIRQTLVDLTERYVSSENMRGLAFTTSRIVVSLVMLILSVALLVGATNNAFIYTRF